MQEAAKQLIDLVETKSPDCIEIVDDQRVANVAVTVDGTWQKRGHTSKIGVVFVISVLTGLILDYQVKSLHCSECKAHEHLDKESDPYKQWKESHSSCCQVNHVGLSEEMEAQGAISIFSRSIATCKLKYKTFVGDGDSSCFGRVKSALEKEFGDKYKIKKEEPKPAGTALRKYKRDKKGNKLSDGKGVQGTGRLTESHGQHAKLLWPSNKRK